MSIDSRDTLVRSRRAVLAAAAGAVAATAATAAAPKVVLADDPNDVVKDQDNATTDVTSITQGTADTVAFQANGSGAGTGLVGTTEATTNAGVVGLAGDSTDSVYVTNVFDIDSGVYGFANQSGLSAGLLGEGPTGVYALGDYGLFADGATVGVFSGAYPEGCAVHAHAGSGTPPAPVSNTALLGTVTDNGQAGLYAHGRVIFPNRSGKTTFKAGQKKKTVYVDSMTSSNLAFAMLNLPRSGVYVRSVKPASGKITINLNKAPSKKTRVAWLVVG